MNEFIAFLVGLIVGSLATVAVWISHPDDQTIQTLEAISACEKSLPRDQHCVYVITAEVKEDE